MKIFVDIDGTICNNTNGDYKNAKPIVSAIHKINRLFENGHNITYWTARGGNSGINWYELTVKQLSDWGCLYHKLSFDKPSFDCVLDDKALKINDVRLGVVGGISGIYKIESKICPGKFYVGSARDITKRWNGHLYHLRKNKHHSPILQNHYNVYGENDLLFSIIEECEIVCLIDKEREYLKTLKPHFNIYEEPGSPKNHKFSDEARKNMSDAHMGKTQSEKTKKKRSLSLTGHSVSKKTTDKIVEKRKNYRHSKETLLKMSISHMGKSYDVDDNENSGSRKRNKGGQFVKKN